MATTGTWPLQSLAPEEKRGGEAGDEGHTEGERRGMRRCGGAFREIEMCSDSHPWMTDGQSQQTGPRSFSKISMCCKTVHNSAAARTVWLGRRVWWECWPVWNDGNVKGSND